MDFPDLMTREQVATYLQLDERGGNVAERLRNLVRFHRLPMHKRGGIVRFRKSEIDAWLADDRAQKRRRVRKAKDKESSASK